MGQIITLTAGNDRFDQSSIGANSSLTIKALAGNDTIVLDRDDDLGGSNLVYAGLGNDVIVNQKESDNVISMSAGDDTYVGLGFGSFSTDLIDQVYGGGGKDTFIVQTFHSEYYGGAGNDVFHSVGWRNTFAGGSGIDTISYRARSDNSTIGDTGVTIDLRAGLVATSATRTERLISIENAIGSTNHDAIFGSAGANKLRGGLGFDQLTGDAGADQFLFAFASEARVAADDADVIMDYSRAEGDKVNLHLMDANSRVAGNQDFRFISTEFTNRAGEVRFEAGFVEGDVNGDGRADFRIFMNEISSMSAVDFLL